MIWFWTRTFQSERERGGRCYVFFFVERYYFSCILLFYLQKYFDDMIFFWRRTTSCIFLFGYKFEKKRERNRYIYVVMKWAFFLPGKSVRSWNFCFCFPKCFDVASSIFWIFFLGFLGIYCIPEWIPAQLCKSAVSYFFKS